MAKIIHCIAEAASKLAEGEVVAIPTETVYGLAGHAENNSAIEKIYSIKKRPRQHPLIMHIAKDAALSDWVEYIPDYAIALMQRFWPGPLTLVFHAKKGKVNPLITGGQTTVAIRCPQHPITQELLKKLNAPLVAPSANPFGKVSPTTAIHVMDSFKNEELYILDGGRCELGIESTIISALNEHYQILRPGLITADMIYQSLQIIPRADDDLTRVPGKLKQHYQPEKLLFYFEHTERLQRFLSQNDQVFLLSFHEYNTKLGYQMPMNPEATAYELYFQLRQADKSSARIIAVEMPPDEGPWQAIRERIMKAGQLGDHL